LLVARKGKLREKTGNRVSKENKSVLDVLNDFLFSHKSQEIFVFDRSKQTISTSAEANPELTLYLQGRLSLDRGAEGRKQGGGGI
jgi:hypothetical protein